MPFTALHVAPALVMKAIAPRLLSIRAFIATQVAIDSEVLLRMLVGIEPLHGFTHTIPGALLASLLAVWCTQIGFVRARIGFDRPLPALTVFFTAVFGAMTHVALDAASHYDMLHLWEVFGAGPQPGIDSVTLDCVLWGAIGAVMLGIRGAFGRLRVHQ